MIFSCPFFVFIQNILNIFHQIDQNSYKNSDQE
jgi:hypothetical protein